MIDNITESIANFLSYVLFLMVILIVISILFRFIFNISDIAIQELIMYLHAVLFMFGISYALKENSHVKIDVIYNTLNKRAQRVISIAGLVSFILPTALFIIYISVDMATQSWIILEGSSEAGGLNLVFILKSLIPITGVLIFLQGMSELIKHIRV